MFKNTMFDPVRNIVGLLSTEHLNQIKMQTRANQIFCRKIFMLQEVINLQRIGFFADIDLKLDKNDVDHNESNFRPIKFTEEYCFLDLNSDGVPQPYIVTVYKNTGDIVRIIAFTQIASEFSNESRN